MRGFRFHETMTGTWRPAMCHSLRSSSRRLAATVRAVTAQRLVPSLRPDVQRVPATEVLLNNITVSEMIRDGADEDLPAVIAGSIEEGMHDFTFSLHRLVEEGWIDMKIAETYAPNAEVLRARVRGIEVKSDVLVSKKLR